ncbi:MAG: hypothetical protein ABR990_13925 [Terracidiphilus sp.]|jgi:hypothetical protein
MNSVVIDQYRLEAEIQWDNEQTPLPVRWIATNIADTTSTAEAWLSLERSRDLLEYVYGEHANSQMELLREHGYLDLVNQWGGKSHCIVTRLTFSASIFRRRSSASSGGWSRSFFGGNI